MQEEKKPVELEILGSKREISQVERAGFMFIMAECLWAALWLTLGVSWGVVSMLLSSSQPLVTTFFTWLFWVVGIVGILVYTPCMCWWAYARGVFE